MVKEIELSKGKVTLVDDDDYDWLSQYKWYYDNAYAIKYWRTVEKKKYKIPMHRLIMSPLKELYIDHINRNTLDNRKLNLRVCTHQENCRNKWQSKEGKSSRYKGVWRNKRDKTWMTAIRIAKEVRKHLGSFETEIEAATAYNEAALKYHGQFARLNSLETLAAISPEREV